MEYRVPEPDRDEDMNNEEMGIIIDDNQGLPLENSGNADLHAGRQLRQTIIDNHFN